MKRKLFFTGLAVAVLTFAVAGWTVQGLRWAFGVRARAYA
jgi:hypothetical protein